MRSRFPLLLVVGALTVPAMDTPARRASVAKGLAIRASAPECQAGDGGITLPDGFCAVVMADGLGRARHLTVASNGDVFVATGQSRGGGGNPGVTALRDTDDDGAADVIRHFGDQGGTGVALHDGFLYFTPDDGAVRYPLDDGDLEPAGPAETIVSGLPGPRSSHGAKSAIVDGEGYLYLNIGSPSNACQEQDRAAGSPGLDPCPELETQAGIWRFSAHRPNQTQADGVRFATGMRNTFALALHPRTGQLWGVQHGRDGLFMSWGELFTAEDQAEKPAEELVQINEGDDFGWPYCYYDPERRLKVLAPEYGGDGETVGRCADAKDPVVALPAHWAPNALAFYTGAQFPERYQGGAFIAFHGSWNRAPLPQGGYNVVFLPFEDGEPTGEWEVFADGFAGEDVSPRGAVHRPSGLAVGPDGSLYVSDDRAGRVWRIMYRGR